ncbi:MAG: T9SS C-terminal target domain-containing protein [Calditrichaeota bacterium]|nr:MAG: T9SS C-terminal target domain-containing protein [Calditrichota bacterium]
MMKKKNVAVFSLVMIVFMLGGIASGVADSQAKKAMMPQTAKIYEASTQNPSERLERIDAVRSSALKAGIELKAADAVAVNERAAQLTEKQDITLLEEKYSKEKTLILENIKKSGASMSVQGEGLAEDDFEPDNSHNQGEKLLDGFVSENHTIYPGGDVDFFWFEGTAGDIVEIVVKTPNPYFGTDKDPYQLLPISEADLDPFMTLYNPDRSVLAQDDDLGYGWDSFLNVELPETGVYYISIEASPEWAIPTVGGYELSFTFLSADGYEEDDDPSTAHLIASGAELTDHNIMPAGDVDFYKFDITVPGTALRGIVVSTPGAVNIRITEMFHNPDLDPAVDIFDESMNLLYSMDDTNNPNDPELGINDVEVLYSFPNPGSYYFVVRSSTKDTGGNTHVGSYKLAFNLVLPDAYEPDNLPGMANVIAYSDEVSDHTITSILDGDMFKFKGSKGDFVSITVDGDNKCGDLDPGVALFGTKDNPGNGTWGPGDLDWLHSSMDDGIGLGAYILWGPLPYNGWYVIEVGADPLSWYNWWERSGSYTLSLEKMGEKETYPNHRNKAIPIAVGDELKGFIPRTGEVWPDDENVDTIPSWYIFDGVEGQTIAATVQTPFQYRSGCGTMQSDWMEDLNPMITLFQADPDVKLAVNENIDPMNEWDDARVVFTLPATGSYYLKVDTEIVEEGPLFEFFGDADSYGEFEISLVTIPRVVDFDSDKNLGHSPLFVNFFDHCMIEDDPWATEFIWDASYNEGLMMYGKEPYYCYWLPRLIGFHDVMKKASNVAGSVMEIKEDFIALYPPNGYAPLVNVDGIGDYPHEPWAAAVDADDYCWTGVATVREEVKGVYPWGTFKFADGKTKLVNKVRIKADAGIGYEERWVRKIRVSTNAQLPTDPYSEILTSLIVDGNWNEFTFDPAIKATNLKLEVLDSDLDSLRGWRQISEFEAYEQIVLPDVEKSLLTATSPHLADGKDAAKIQVKLIDKDGNPITVYDDKDVKFYLTDCKDGYFGPIDLSEASQGIYKTTLVMTTPGTYQVFAVAHGAIMLNNKPDRVTPTFVTFFNYKGQKGDLVFVEGSPTFGSETWENAIDHDGTGWDGTVTAGGSVCYAIFKFSNDMQMPMNKVGLITDNGFEDDKYESRQVRKFEVYVSDDMATWILAGAFTRNGSGGYTRYKFPVVLGKYVKLVIVQPSNGWRQVVEFEAIFDTHDGFAKWDAEEAAIPTEYAVANAYPNPFNPTTTIQYQLPEEMRVKISIFNVLGQQVQVLLDENKPAGYHSVMWDAANQPSGVYLYRVEAGTFVQTKQMVLLK